MMERIIKEVLESVLTVKEIYDVERLLEAVNKNQNNKEKRKREIDSIIREVME